MVGLTCCSNYIDLFEDVPQMYPHTMNSIYRKNQAGIEPEASSLMIATQASGKTDQQSHTA